MLDIWVLDFATMCIYIEQRLVGLQDMHISTYQHLDEAMASFSMSSSRVIMIAYL